MNPTLLFRLFKPVRLLLLTLSLVLLLQVSAPAQPSYGLVESRLNRLESSIYTLQSQLNQLSNEIARVSRSAGLNYTPPPASATRPAAPAAPSALASDPTFQRLANLFIELKERVVAIETRLAEFEAAQP